MFCERCEKAEATLECADCSPKEESQPVRFCVTCSQLIHDGKRMAKHTLSSFLVKKETEIMLLKIADQERCSGCIKLRMDETEVIKADLEERQKIYERSIRESVTDIQHSLKLKAMEMITKLRDNHDSKKAKLMECCEIYKSALSKSSENRCKVEELLRLNDEDFMNGVKDVSSKLVPLYDDDELRRSFPVLDTSFTIDFAGVQQAIQALHCDIQLDSSSQSEQNTEDTPSSSGEGTEVMGYAQSLLSKEGCFWLQPNMSDDTVQKLIQIGDGIRRLFYQSPDWMTFTESCTTPSVGALVFAKFSCDRKWYRGKVESLDERKESAAVRFLDFGNLDYVSYCHLLPCRDDILPELPYQAMEVSLIQEECPLPLEARWLFTDTVKDQPLTCTFKSKIDVCNDKECWLVEVKMEGDEVSLNDLVLVKAKALSKPKDSIVSVDYRLAENPSLVHDVRIERGAGEPRDSHVSIADGEHDGYQAEDQMQPASDAEFSKVTSPSDILNEQQSRMSPVPAHTTDYRSKQHEDEVKTNSMSPEGAVLQCNGESLMSCRELSGSMNELVTGGRKSPDSCYSQDGSISTGLGSDTQKKKKKKKRKSNGDAATGPRPEHEGQFEDCKNYGNESIVVLSHGLDLDPAMMETVASSPTHGEGTVDLLSLEHDRLVPLSVEHVTIDMYPALAQTPHHLDCGCMYEISTDQELDNDGTFWASFVMSRAQEEEFAKYQMILNKHALTAMPPGDIDMNHVMLAPYEGEWFRSQVECCDEEKAKVRYLDFGNFEYVNRKLLKSLPMELSSNVPFQSIKCSISLDSCQSITSEMKTKFEGLTREKTLIAKTLTMICDDSIPSALVMLKVKDTGQDVVHELQTLCNRSAGGASVVGPNICTTSPDLKRNAQHILALLQGQRLKETSHGHDGEPSADTPVDDVLCPGVSFDIPQPGNYDESEAHQSVNISPDMNTLVNLDGGHDKKSLGEKCLIEFNQMPVEGHTIDQALSIGREVMTGEGITQEPMPFSAESELLDQSSVPSNAEARVLKGVTMVNDDDDSVNCSKVDWTDKEAGTPHLVTRLDKGVTEEGELTCSRRVTSDMATDFNTVPASCSDFDDVGSLNLYKHAENGVRDLSTSSSWDNICDVSSHEPSKADNSDPFVDVLTRATCQISGQDDNFQTKQEKETDKASQPKGMYERVSSLHSSMTHNTVCMQQKPETNRNTLGIRVSTSPQYGRPCLSPSPQRAITSLPSLSYSHGIGGQSSSIISDSHPYSHGIGGQSSSIISDSHPYSHGIGGQSSSIISDSHPYSHGIGGQSSSIISDSHPYQSPNFPVPQQFPITNITVPYEISQSSSFIPDLNLDSALPPSYILPMAKVAVLGRRPPPATSEQVKVGPHCLQMAEQEDVDQMESIVAHQLQPTKAVAVEMNASMEMRKPLPIVTVPIKEEFPILTQDINQTSSDVTECEASEDSLSHSKDVAESRPTVDSLPDSFSCYDDDAWVEGEMVVSRPAPVSRPPLMTSSVSFSSKRYQSREKLCASGCYNCKQTGHYMRECPRLNNKRHVGGRSGQRGDTVGSKTRRN